MPTDLAKHLAYLGTSDEVALGSKDVALAVVAFCRVGQTELHVARDWDRPCDLLDQPAQTRKPTLIESRMILASLPPCGRPAVVKSSAAFSGLPRAAGVWLLGRLELDAALWALADPASARQHGARTCALVRALIAGAAVLIACRCLASAAGACDRFGPKIPSCAFSQSVTSTGPVEGLRRFRRFSQRKCIIHPPLPPAARSRSSSVQHRPLTTIKKTLVCIAAVEGEGWTEH